MFFCHDEDGCEGNDDEDHDDDDVDNNDKYLFKTRFARYILNLKRESANSNPVNKRPGHKAIIDMIG